MTSRALALLRWHLAELEALARRDLSPVARERVDAALARARANLVGAEA